MKQLLFALLAFSSLHSSAQHVSRKKAAKYNTMHAIDSQEMKNGYTNYLYEDKSGNIHFIGQVGVNVEFASNEAFTASLKGNADVFFKHRFSVGGSYSYAFLDNARGDSKSNPNKSENETSVPTFMEVGGRIILRQRNRDVKHMVIVGRSRRIRNEEVNYYLKPKLPSLNMLAVRGGYIAYNTVVSTDMNDKVLSKEGHGVVMANDGTALTDNYYTSAFFKGGYLGFSSIRMINSLTKNTYRSRNFYRTKYMREYYADILFASAAFDPIIDQTIKREITADAAGSFQTSKVGGRIGVLISSYDGIRPMSARLEGGYRPNLSGSGWYIGIGWGLCLIK